MGVPNSEVGYTSAMPRREDHEVRKGHVGLWMMMMMIMIIIIIKTLSSVLLTNYYSRDKIKKNEMGRAHSTYGKEEKCIQGLGGEKWWKQTTWNTQA